MDDFINTKSIQSGGPMPAIIITGVLIVIVFAVVIILLYRFGIIKGGSIPNRMGFTNRYNQKKRQMY